MKLFLLLLSLSILDLPTSVSAEKHYRLYGSYKALHRVEYDSFTDTRDGQSYKIYKVEKHFSSNRCSGTEYCLDTAFIYMFAENIRYNTPHGVCYVNDCKKYGRYYPREDIEHVCPTGWSISSAEEANIVDYITFDGNTIYGISDRWLFPRTETYVSVDDSIIPTLSFLKIAYSPDSPSISHDLMICFICLRVSAKPNLAPRVVDAPSIM